MDERQAFDATFAETQANALAAATRRAYAAALAQYERWHKAQHGALPPPPQQDDGMRGHMYLKARANEATAEFPRIDSPATLKLTAAALKHGGRLPVPPGKTAAQQRQFLRGVISDIKKRGGGRYIRRAAALRAPALRAALAMPAERAGEAAAVMLARNKALLALLWLAVGRQDDILAARAEDLRLTPAGERGALPLAATLTLRAGKTQQAGAPLREINLLTAMQYAALRPTAAAALRAVEQWARIRAALPGLAGRAGQYPYLFCGLAGLPARLRAGLRGGAAAERHNARYGKRLTPTRAGALLATFSPAAGVEITGHSCRRGAAQDLHAAGMPLEMLIVAGGWSDLRTLGAYMAAAAGGTAAAATAEQPEQAAG